MSDNPIVNHDHPLVNASWQYSVLINRGWPNNGFEQLGVFPSKTSAMEATCLELNKLFPGKWIFNGNQFQHADPSVGYTIAVIDEIRTPIEELRREIAHLETYIAKRQSELVALKQQLADELAANYD